MSNVTGVNAAMNLLKRSVSARRFKGITQQLAEIGRNTADNIFSMSDYDGDREDLKVVTQNIKDGTAVVAKGQTVLFREYGSGLIGYGHPDPKQYGPGTWSDGPNGQGHWDDPNGWYIPKRKKPNGIRHTFGNPPAMAMYEAGKEIDRNIDRVVRENLK